MKKNKFKTQVEKEHYHLKNYDSMPRFVGYWMQIDSINNLKNVTSVLEVGVGNKTVANYLNNHGYNVTTCDHAAFLKPDYVADVRQLPMTDNTYDVSLCCEVLEHIPLKDLPKSLRELGRVSKKYVIVSVPYYCAFFEVFFTFSLGYIIKAFDIAMSIPYFFLKPKFTGEHYWGLGIRGISKKIFRRHAKKAGLKIIKEFREPLYPHHYYFVMKKI